MSDPLTVACIGLGKMGAGIAANIVAAGFDTAVWNRTAERTRPLVDGGARAEPTPAAAAAGADVVISCLFDDESVLATTLGDDGILAGMAPVAVHAGTTSVSPDCTRRLAAAHGSRYLAAHVLGRPDAARQAQLVVLAGGPAATVERARPVLDAFSRGVTVVGDDPAHATHTKLMANYAIVATIEVIGEVYAWAEKVSVDRQVVRDLLDNLLAGPALPGYNHRIADRSFETEGFALDGGLKDIGLILEASGEVHAPLPVAGIIRDRLLTAVGRDMAALDWAALTEIARYTAGLD